MASKYKWLLDPGHGGILHGQPQTPGKRSPVWPDGSQLFEGEFNRSIVSNLIELCKNNNIDCYNIVNEIKDISREERINRANKQFDKDHRCIYLSIHANAGGGKGWEIYTSKGETQSDKIASVFFQKFKEEFPQIRMRSDISDGDPDKEAQFDVLVNTKMPAILTENFFMDNYEECKNYLMNEEGRKRIAKAHFDAIMEMEKLNLT